MVSKTKTKSKRKMSTAKKIGLGVAGLLGAIGVYHGIKQYHKSKQLNQTGVDKSFIQEKKEEMEAKDKENKKHSDLHNRLYYLLYKYNAPSFRNNSNKSNKPVFSKAEYDKIHDKINQNKYNESDLRVFEIELKNRLTNQEDKKTSKLYNWLTGGRKKRKRVTTKTGGRKRQTIKSRKPKTKKKTKY